MSMNTELGRDTILADSTDSAATTEAKAQEGPYFEGLIGDDIPTKGGPQRLTLDMQVGRPGSENLDGPWTIRQILDGKSPMPTGKWVDVAGPCPFYPQEQQGPFHRGAMKTSYMLNDGRLSVICRNPAHNHSPTAHKVDRNGNDQWSWSISLDTPKTQYGGPMGPFDRRSIIEFAKAVIDKYYPVAVWETDDTIRCLDTVSTEGKWMDEAKKRVAGKSTVTSGMWHRVHREKVAEKVRTLDQCWLVTKDKKGNDVAARLTLSRSEFGGVMEQIFSILKGRAATKCHGLQVRSEMDTTVTEPYIAVRNAIYLPLATMPTARWKSGVYAVRPYMVRAEDAHTDIEPWAEMSMDAGDGLLYLPDVFRDYLQSAWGGLDDYKERLSYLQEWIGVALVGETCRYQQHTILMGVPASGKSTLLSIVSQLFPPSVRASVAPHVLGHNFGAASLIGARINTVAEIDGSTAVPSDRLKMWTTGDTVTVDIKHRDPVMVTPRCAWMIGANQSFRLTEGDSSVFRRWVILTFPRVVPAEERNTNLVADIMQHKAAILAWAMAGYARFRANGNRYTVPPSSAAAIGTWRAETDSVVGWLRDGEVEVLDDLGDDESAASAARRGTAAKTHYAAYVEWCKSTGHMPVTMTRFGLRLKDQGVWQVRSMHGMCHGVKLTVTFAHDPVDL